MCEVVSDEMNGQIVEMRNVLSTLMHLHFDGKKEELRKFCENHITTIKQISYFLEHTNNDTTVHRFEHEQIHQLFKQIASGLSV